MFSLKIAHFAVDIVSFLLLIAMAVYLSSKFGDLRSIRKPQKRQAVWSTDLCSAPRDGRPILVRIRAWNKPDGQILERVAWWIGEGWKEFPSRDDTLWQPIEWKDLPE